MFLWSLYLCIRKSVRAGVIRVRVQEGGYKREESEIIMQTDTGVAACW